MSTANLVLANVMRVARTYALALWVGGLVFFVAVAQVAFSNLPSTHEAGLVVRGSLITIHNIGMVCGVIYIVAAFLLIVLNDRHRVHYWEILIVCWMIIFTYYSQHSVIPTMERDRIALFQQFGTEVDKSPATAPERQEFDRLHNISTKVEGTTLLLGLFALALGVIKPKEKTA